MRDVLIHYECRRPEHLRTGSRLGLGGITIREGEWAYCDGQVEDPEHQWHETGGAPLHTLVRAARRATTR